MRCPQCNSVFPDDTYFCVNDGNSLVDDNGEQPTAANQVFSPAFPDPTGASPGNPVCMACGSVNQTNSMFCNKCGAAVSPAVQSYGGFEVPIYTSDSTAVDFNGPPVATQYAETTVFTRPGFAQPGQQLGGKSLNRGVIVGLVAAITILLGTCVILLVMLGSGTRPAENEKAPAQATNTQPKNSNSTNLGENTPPHSQPDNAGTDDTVTKPSAPSEPEMSPNIEHVFRGHGGRLPLTLTLTRNSDHLSGAALTPGDRDDLDGTVSSDGTFSLRGYNLKENRITGYWSGRINNRSVSGIWTATPSGRKVSFSGTR